MLAIVLAMCVVICILGIHKKSDLNVSGVTEFDSAAETVTESETDENKPLTANHLSCNQWFNNTKSVMSGVYEYMDDIYMMFSNESNKMFLYDSVTGTTSMLCRKEDCMHNNKKDCTSALNLSYVNVYEGEIFAVEIDNAYNIIHIYDDNIEIFHKSDNPIREMWCYRNYIYYCTDYKLLRINMDAPGEDEKEILDRPVLFSYLQFKDDTVFYEDDSYYLYMNDLDGGNEKILVSQIVNMPEVGENDVFYRNGSDNCIYRLDLNGSDPECIVSSPVKRFVIDGNNIFYIPIGEDALYVLNIDTGEKELLCGEIGNAEISYVADEHVILSVYEEVTEGYEEYMTMTYRDLNINTGMFTEIIAPEVTR